MDEIWRSVGGYEGFYEVSNIGRVRRMCSTSIMHRKFTDKDIVHIMSSQKSIKSMAKELGVATATIAKVRHGVSYRPYEPKILLHALGTDGYPFVVLSKGGKTKQVTCHKLVTAAFLGPRGYRMQVNHKDGNRTNNKIDNLEYVTNRENTIHACDVLRRTGYKINPDIAAEMRILKGTLSYRELARIYNLSIGYVGKVMRREAWYR